jgi:hypothetical protein
MGYGLDKPTSLPSGLYQLVRSTIDHNAGWTLPLVMEQVLIKGISKSTHSIKNNTLGEI